VEVVLGPMIGVLIAQGTFGGGLVLSGIVFAAAVAAASLLPGLGRRRADGDGQVRASAAVR